jgi:peptide/nickel transport system permease protein
MALMTDVQEVAVPSVDALPAAVLASPKVKKPWGLAFWVAVVWLVTVVTSTTVGSLVGWKTEVDFIGGGLTSDGHWFQTVGMKHPFGLTFSGNDIFNNVIIGAKNSLTIAAFTVVFGFLIGGTFGMIAGYFRGRADTAISFVMNVIVSIPALLFILMFIAVTSASSDASGLEQGLQSSVGKVSFSLGILSIPIIFRVVRASTIQFAEREFVMAARSMGAKVPRILFREILPNVSKPMLAFGLVAAGTVMVIEGGLSFLGVGVGAGTDVTAWGKQIAEASTGETKLFKSPMVALIPGLCLFFTVLSLNFIGDKVRERLEVKQAAL